MTDPSRLRSVVTSTPRLRIRRMSLDDAPLMLAVLTDPDFVRFVGDRGVRDLAAASQYLADGALAEYARFGYGMFAVERRDDAASIGICGVMQRPFLPAPDLGYAMLPPFRGRGYMREAAIAVRDHARDALLLPELLAVASKQNVASNKLLESLGFRLRGDFLWPGADSPGNLWRLAFGSGAPGHDAPTDAPQRR